MQITLDNSEGISQASYSTPKTKQNSKNQTKSEGLQKPKQTKRIHD
jgi:hypothetical protein